jgi:hypothetical protein
MGLLYKELGLTDNRLQEIVCHTAVDVMMYDHTDDGDISSLPDAERKRLNDNFKIGLNYLQANKIIRFSEELYMYRIVVLNEYRLHQLIGELKWLETYLDGVSGKTPPPNDDMAFYERSSGNVIINGTRKTLKGTNKKLFDALFIQSPEPVTKSNLRKIVGIRKRDFLKKDRKKHKMNMPETASEKEAINGAFSNLRKACGVTSRTITLGLEGGRLRARAMPLIEADEIYLSNFLTA